MEGSPLSGLPSGLAGLAEEIQGKAMEMATADPLAVLAPMIGSMMQQLNLFLEAADKNPQPLSHLLGPRLFDSLGALKVTVTRTGEDAARALELRENARAEHPPPNGGGEGEA